MKAGQIALTDRSSNSSPLIELFTGSLKSCTTAGLVSFVSNWAAVNRVLVVAFDDSANAAVPNHRTCTLIAYACNRFSIHCEVRHTAADNFTAVRRKIANTNYLRHNVLLLWSRFLVIFRIYCGNRGISEYVT